MRHCWLPASMRPTTSCCSCPKAPCLVWCFLIWQVPRLSAVPARPVQRNIRRDLSGLCSAGACVHYRRRTRQVSGPRAGPFSACSESRVKTFIPNGLPTCWRLLSAGSVRPPDDGRQRISGFNLPTGELPNWLRSLSVSTMRDAVHVEDICRETGVGLCVTCNAPSGHISM